MNPSSNNFFYNNVLQMFLSTTFVMFIQNHSTCVHNIFETLLCKHIKEVYNINNFLMLNCEKPNTSYMSIDSF
jgi:hypothetical protein